MTETSNPESAKAPTTNALGHNASSGQSTEIRNDSRRVLFRDVRDNSLGRELYEILMEYQRNEERGQLVSEAKVFVQAHRRTMDKLADM